MRGAGPVAASLTLSLASYLPLCSGLVSPLCARIFLHSCSLHVFSYFGVIFFAFLSFRVSLYSCNVLPSPFYISFFARLSSHISFQPCCCSQYGIFTPSPCFSLSFPYWTFISRPTALSPITPAAVPFPSPCSLNHSICKSPFPFMLSTRQIIVSASVVLWLSRLARNMRVLVRIPSCPSQLSIPSLRQIDKWVPGETRRANCC